MMNLPLRQKRILKMLLEQDGWIKGKDIAEEMNVTMRTVRTDIAIINAALKESDCQIESSRQEGYRLKGEDQEVIHQLLFDRDKIPNTPEERMRLVSIRLLETDENRPEDIEDLEEEMIISRATLETTILKVKTALESRSNPIYIKRKGGKIWVSGDEETKRFFLRELIIDRTEPNYMLLDNYTVFFGPDIPELIKEIVIDALKDNRLAMTGDDLLHLVIYLAIKHMRISLGHTLREEKINEFISGDNNSKMALYIADRIEESLGITFNDAEMMDFVVQLSLLQLIFHSDEQKEKSKSMVEPYFENLIETLLEDIKERFWLDLTDDEELKIGMTIHIQHMVNRIKDITKIMNPISLLLKTEYPFAFEMALFLYERFYELFNIRLNEDELGYLAAYLGAALERMENSKEVSELSIAVISSTNYGVSRLLMTRLKSIYGERCRILGPFTMYEEKEILSTQPSLILTTGRKLKIGGDQMIPQLRISPILNDRDLVELNKMINNKKRESFHYPLPQDIRFYFNESLFFPYLPVNSREEAIRIMSQRLIEKGYVFEDFIEKTLERESIAATAFANGVAMPHPIEACAICTAIAVAILDKPVAWGNTSAQLIFMLAVKKEDMPYLNHFFNITVRLVDDSNLVSRLMDSKNLDSFLAQLL